jgi:hypothetical protein
MRSSSLHNRLLLKESVTGRSGLVGVFVVVKAVKRTWTRQKKIFCVRANLAMLWPCAILEICLKNRILSDGVGWVGQHLLDAAGIFCPVLRNKSNCSILVLEVLLSCLQGHVNEEARTIFSRDYRFDSLVNLAKQAIAFCEAQIKATKDAMLAWTLVGIKLKVVKDVRKLIARLIWDSREEALYDVSEGEEEQEEEEEEEEEPMRAEKRYRK